MALRKTFIQRMVSNLPNTKQVAYEKSELCADECTLPCFLRGC